MPILASNNPPAEPRPYLTKESSIFRYRPMGFFIDEFDTSETYMRRADKLEDKFEGSIGGGNAILQDSQPWGRSMSHEGERYRRRVFLQCWQIAEHEDIAMWERYGQGGVAIKSTIAQVRAQLDIRADATPDKPIREYSRLTFVDYLELENHIDMFSIIPSVERFLTKRMEFRSEREYRIIRERSHVLFDDDSNGKIDDSYAFDEGLRTPVIWTSLANEIILHPNALQTVEENVRDVLNNLSMGDRFRRSNLDGNPRF